MSIQIDKYYVTMNKYGHIGICIDGQLIIHTKINFTNSREEVIQEAINLIKKYNNKHGLIWGESE